jgi:hypothetical protein
MVAGIIRPVMATRKSARHHHHVYVVEPSDRVWNEAAREMEVELAIGLREAGYGVWQA